MTTRELSMLAESISVRLHLFKREYPIFLPHLVKAIMEHPNLKNSDRSTLDTYCNLFELDWKFDKSVENREKFLIENPVYLDSKYEPNLENILGINQKWISDKIKTACVPFLPILIEKIKVVKDAPFNEPVKVDPKSIEPPKKSASKLKKKTDPKPAKAFETSPPESKEKVKQVKKRKISFLSADIPDE